MGNCRQSANQLCGGLWWCGEQPTCHSAKSLADRDLLHHWKRFPEVLVELRSDFLEFFTNFRSLPSFFSINVEAFCLLLHLKGNCQT
jgi:hypothetical protein